MKKCLTVLLFVLCMVCAVSVLAETSGDYEYTVLQDGTAEITKYTGKAKQLTIPNALGESVVTSIGEKAFYSSNITSVNIPISVTKVGNQAFSFCRDLTRVTIPEGVTIIGDRVFNSCTNLNNVLIPGSLTYIGQSPFSNCRVLSSLEVSPKNQIFAIVNGVLFSKSDYRLVWYPMTAIASSYTIPQGTRVIGENAFSNCTNLKEVIIANSVTTIGNHAFAGCNKLQKITIPDSVAAVGDCAFLSCDNLLRVEIPDSVTIIGANPFSFCQSLTSVEVSPNHPTLATIDGVLFSKPDKRLVWYPITSTNTTYVIPQGIRSIGEYAFYFSNGLKNVIIPDSVTSIEDGAFVMCFNLTSVMIPNSVTSIGNDAFYFCENLISVTIPDSVVSIGASAFSYCKSLTRVTISKNVTCIGEKAFANCPGPITVFRDSYAAQYCKENNLNYTYTDSLDWLLN